MTQDEKYMKEAMKQARKAYVLGEVPIGCVIVYEDQIIGRGYNRRTIDKNTIHKRIAATIVYKTLFFLFCFFPYFIAIFVPSYL